MQKTKYVLGVTAIAGLLAACSPLANGPAGGGGATTPPPVKPTPQPVTQTSSVTEAVSLYVASNPTTYGASGLTTSTDALEAPGGNSAFGVGNVAAVSAAADMSALKIGNVAIDRDAKSLTLTVDGVARTLNYVDNYQGAEYFGFSMSNPNNGEAVALANMPYQGNYLDNPDERTENHPGYVSLAVHLKGGTWEQETVDIGNGQTQQYYVLKSAAEYNALVTGLLTAEANMPTTAKADYAGQWSLVSGHKVADFFTNNGRFLISADFVNKTLSGKAGDIMFDIADSNTSLDGKIAGNTFTATATRTDATGLNGTIGGAFFGPSAQQIAGTGTGSVIVNGAEADAVLLFTGQQYPEGYLP